MTKVSASEQKYIDIKKQMANGIRISDEYYKFMKQFEWIRSCRINRRCAPKYIENNKIRLGY